MILFIQILAAVLTIWNVAEKQNILAVVSGLCLIATFWLQEDKMKLHKEQLNECHILKFENGLMYIQIGQEWEVVELWCDKTNCFRYVWKENLNDQR